MTSKHEYQTQLAQAKTMATSERNILPGSPSNSLVRNVRRALLKHLQCKPSKDNQTWIDAWRWADSVATRPNYFTGQAALRKRWPEPNEIATQYLLLALTHMKNDKQLMLPMDSAKYMPPEVKKKISASNPQRLQSPLIGIELSSEGNNHQH